MKASPPSYPISFLVEDHRFLDYLQNLPWQYPIEEWRQLGVKHLNIKAGISRHPVVFVQADGRNLVVKQLGFEVAQREVDNYKKMLLRGIHTLIPIGCVMREEEPIAVKTPVGKIKENVLDFFPGKTASELYVEIMNNKYVLSKDKGKDVGIIHATRDYAKKYGQEPPFAAFWNGLARKVREILRMQP